MKKSLFFLNKKTGNIVWAKFFPTKGHTFYKLAIFLQKLKKNVINLKKEKHVEAQNVGYPNINFIVFPSILS